VKLRNFTFFLIVCGLPLLIGCRGLGGVSSGDLAAVNHVVFMLQENRSFDTYFGQLNAYRQAHGLPADVDGMPANAANPADNGTKVSAFKLNTLCPPILAVFARGWHACVSRLRARESRVSKAHRRF
jgi:hypothetical protein